MFQGLKHIADVERTSVKMNHFPAAGTPSGQYESCLHKYTKLGAPKRAITKHSTGYPYVIGL